MTFLDMPVSERSAWILRHADNAPVWCRPTLPLRLGTLELRVAPDYWGVLEGEVFLRTPIDAPAAQAIATRYGYQIGTKQLVDAVWNASNQRLLPARTCLGMRTVEAIRDANASDEAQLEGVARETLVAGHRVDVVLSNAIRLRPGRVARYGALGQNGHPIQRLTSRLNAGYTDALQGVRMFDARCWIEGVEHRLADVLQSRVLAGSVSHEGPLQIVRYP